MSNSRPSPIRYLLAGGALALLVMVGCIVGGAAVFFFTTGESAPQPASSVAPVPAPPTVAAPASTPPDSRALLQAEQSWLGTLYASTSPSVVNITSRSYSYSFFFEVVPQEGTGSGFVWDEAGHIVTNFHVIEGSQELEVTLADGTQRPATVVGIDPGNDLAVLRVDDPALTLPPPLLLGEAATAMGQRVVAIGNPFGYERTLTTGVISALGRVIQSEGDAFIGEVIQHDAAINPGNSGGPLLDLDGRVIGINTQIVSPSGASAGIGYAIPAATVARVVPELIARGHYPHPWLGLQSLDVTPGLAGRLRANNIPLDAESGLLVQGIYRGGPAEGLLRAGTRRVRAGNLLFALGGDLVVALDDAPIADQRAMYLYLENEKQVGDPVRIRFWRDGQLQEVETVLAERPTQLR